MSRRSYASQDDIDTVIAAVWIRCVEHSMADAILTQDTCSRRVVLTNVLSPLYDTKCRLSKPTGIWAFPKWLTSVCGDPSCGSLNTAT